jgi:hypothetical protein
MDSVVSTVIMLQSGQQRNRNFIHGMGYMIFLSFGASRPAPGIIQRPPPFKRVPGPFPRR